MGPISVTFRGVQPEMTLGGREPEEYILPSQSYRVQTTRSHRARGHSQDTAGWRSVERTTGSFQHSQDKGAGLREAEQQGQARLGAGKTDGTSRAAALEQVTILGL